MSDDGNESDADIGEETPPMPAPDAEGDDGGASAAGAGGRKKRRSGTVARAPSKAQTKMVHSCIVKVSFVGVHVCDFQVIICVSFVSILQAKTGTCGSNATHGRESKPSISQPKSFIH